MPLKILSGTIFRHLGFLRMTIAPSIYTIHIYTVTRLICDRRTYFKPFILGSPPTHLRLEATLLISSSVIQYADVFYRYRIVLLVQLVKCLF